MARIPTAGGHHDDATLLAIADKLDHDAARLESQSTAVPHEPPETNFKRRA
jgi:hypothetical protein